MINLKISFDSHESKVWLNAIESKQIAFAASRSLNVTAKETVETIRNDLPKKFRLRNSWTRKGIIFAGCNKREWPHLSVIIGSKDWYMKDQETGGDRKPLHKSFTVPYGVIKNPDKLIPLSRRAKALLKGYHPYRGGRRPGKASGSAVPKPFIQETKSGKIGIFIRKDIRRYPIGSGSKGSFTQGKAVYWIVKRPINIKAREWLVQNTRKAVERFPWLFQVFFKEAIEKAR